MPWIRIDDEMPDHPKVEPLSDAAFRWLFRGLSYANRFLTNGVLPPIFLAKVPAAVLDELTTIRDGQKTAIWKRRASGEVRIHDYQDYQPTRSKVEKNRRATRDRQERFRKRLKEETERQLPLPEGDEPDLRNAVTNAVGDAVTNSAPSRPGPSLNTNTKIPLTPASAGGRITRGERKRAEAELRAFRNQETQRYRDSGGPSPTAPIWQQSQDLAESGLTDADLYQRRRCPHTPECRHDDDCIVLLVVALRHHEANLMAAVS